MDASAIQAKYTRVVKIAGKWNCYLQIDHQGFCIVDNRTKKEANWYAKMIGIALERLVASVKNTEQQVQPDNGGMCTRPDVFDCHAKVGTGGRCMNIVPCPSLQVN